MSNLTEEIRKKLYLGEDSALEFKSGEITGKSRKEEWHKLADEMTAFANSGGGALVFGINDNQEVAGLSKSQLNTIEKKGC